MNSRRGSTASPMSIEKTWSTALASSIVTSCSVRFSGSIVVSKSWSAFISPRPLNRCSGTPSRATSSTFVRSSSNDSARASRLPSTTSNGGVPASDSSSLWIFTKPAYSGVENIARESR